MTRTKKIYFFFIILTMSFFLLDVNTLSANDLTEETGKKLLIEIEKLNKSLEGLKKPNKKPAQKEVKVTTKGGVTLGKKNAPVTIVEFTDYQCPFCKRFMDSTFLEIKKKYIDTGKVKFVSRNMPLPFHKEAQSAAEAVMCTGEQSKKKYWKMRDIVFNNPRALSEEDLLNYGAELSLNMAKFSQCIKSKKHLTQINKDMADARSIGITGTPSFIIAPSNGTELTGELIIGAQGFSAFDTVIKKMLKK